MAVSTVLEIDGSHGEGGGQILRTALSLSAIKGRPLHISRIRANRPKPGLAAQHVTSIRAAGAVCGAEIEGDALGSDELRFAPAAPPVAGDYAFDVDDARPDGSAGSATLILQTVLMPLALASGRSIVRVRGGTHMMWSPSFDYLHDVWLPTLREIGIATDAELTAWGWFPIGKGEVCLTIEGGGRPKSLSATGRGELTRITGRAVAANLHPNIPNRMAMHATLGLRDLTPEVHIEPLTVRAACAGAGIFLTAHYENASCGFTGHGVRGKPAEQVADEAVADLRAHHASGAAFEVHLADQMLLPLALGPGPSSFTTERITLHLKTNAWVIEQFGLARVAWTDGEKGPPRVTVTPSAGLSR